MKINELYKALVQQGASAQNSQGEIKLKLPKQLDATLKQQLISRKGELKIYLATLFEKAASTPAIMPVERDKSGYPLSSTQQRLWFIDKLQGKSNEYNMTAAFSVSTGLDLELVEQAMNAIICRHEILRTSYKEFAGEVQQVVNPQQKLKLQYDDLSKLNETQQATQLTEILASESDHIFDLSSELLLRVRYVHLAAEQKTAVLLFNMHHIVADGWSIQVLTNEFKLIYQELVKKEEISLPLLSIQYLDYAQWQQNESADRYNTQLAYWQQQLAELPVVHNLPLDFMRPAVKQHQAQQVSSCLDVKISREIERQAKALNVSPFMFLHAVLSLVLGVHSHSHDIVVGTPVANRLQPELEPLIGFFANTLALRVSTEFTTLADYFNHVKQVHQDAIANQEIPFDQLVEQLNIPRNLAHSPMFQILFSVEGEPAKPIGSQLILANASLETMALDAGSSKFDLDITFSFTEQGLQTTWNFDQSLFKKQHVSALNQHVCHLIEALCNLNETQLRQQTSKDLPILSSEEREYLLHTVNANSQSYDHSASLVTGFENQARLKPDQIALEVDGQKISYQALNQQANQLACYLHEQYEINQDTPIGVCCHRSADMLIAILAILKAGGAYLPLDPNYPAARLDQIVSDAKPAVILTMADTGASLVGEKLDITKLDVSQCSQEDLNRAYSPQQLAYVIYTSGSTGRPKGVAISHKSAVAMLNWAAATYTEIDYQRVLASTSINFDLSVFELFLPLSMGGTCVLVDNALSLLTQSIKVSLINTVPSAIKTLLEQDAIPAGIKVINLAGEPLSGDTVNQLIQSGHCERVYNLYGPSEDTTYSTYACFNKVVTQQPTIGRVINNSQAYILADDLSLLPLGAAGELYLGGDGLARGYLNQPKMTAERFIDNPFYDANDPASSTRLYRTGDLVRYLSDGNLSFIGRVDDQVKIRGFRIELGEIAHQLNQQPEVDSALILAKDGAVDKHLVAYVKPQNSTESDFNRNFIEQIFTKLADSLPDYMVPALGVVINEWPLTPNGKIDIRALPEPDAALIQGDYIPPNGEIETRLVAIWSQLLGLAKNKISTKANFFNLGGNSLMSVRLASEIRAQLAVEISIKRLFNANTIQGQAEAVANCQDKVLRKNITPIARNEFDDLGSAILPVSFSQQRLWFLDQLQGPSAEYNMPAAFNVGGKLNLSVVERALSTIINRHEILRTVYRDGEQGAEQIIRNSTDFKLVQQDVSGLDTVEQQQTIAACIQRILEMPFNLREDLMVRASYIHTSNSSGILLFNMHHIASDGWSMQVLVQEFVDLYLAYSQGLENPLSPLSIQYGDFAQWQREYLQADIIKQQLDYWQKQLNELPAVHSLPLDFNRPQVKQHQGAIVSSQLNSEVAKNLIRLGKDHGLTPFMLLHSALALVLSRHSNSQDIVIGTPVANRLQAELEPLIGFFVNTLVLRVDTAKQNLSDYLNHVKEVHLDAQTNQDVSFEQLVEHLNIPRSIKHTPLFQIMLTTNNDYGLAQDVSESNWTLDGIEMSPLHADSVIAKFDLDINMTINEDGGSLDWTYDTNLFSHDHIESLNNHLCRLLAGLGALELSTIAHTKLATLPMLSQQEQQHLLTELNQTQTEYDNSACIQQLFEHQVQLTPNAIALKFQDQQMSYRELNQAANCMAHALINDYQVKPDTLVGLCCERSIEMVIAILAILKAGGAYIPLDPAYPEDRLTFMVEDAALTLILSHGSGHDVAQSVMPKGTLLEISTLLSGLAQSKNSNPRVKGLSAGNLAYVIYTSGSTGKPKGVMVEHQALVNYQCHIRQGYGITAADSILQFSTISFDIFVEECFGALCLGARLVLRDEHCMSSAAAFYDYCRQQRISVLSLPTAFWQQLSASEEVFDIPTLRSIIVGGEALSPSIAKGFLSQVNNVTLFNSYGPTEATVTATTAKLSRVNDCDQITIGKANANNYLLVLGPELQLQPFGTEGELYIGGDGVARGYLNRDELNTKHFISNPYYDADIPGSAKRLYKTGDLVSYTKKGELLFVGRNDEQVKFRGFRIELGEINQQLHNLKQVTDARVQVFERDENKYLVAYIKPNGIYEEADLINTIRQQLVECLPDYMVPNSFNIIDEIPLTQNGKLDRKALPAPQLHIQQSEYIAARTETQIRLVRMWSELLGHPEDQISIAANFFSLGGHSLLILKANTHIQHIFDIQLNVRAFFQYSSIESLAEHIDSQKVQQKLKQQFENIDSDDIEKVEF